MLPVILIVKFCGFLESIPGTTGFDHETGHDNSRPPSQCSCFHVRLNGR